ncbi:hypothetical protein TcCL_Unassigned04425, partial [Trypanosoma cruzi]
MGLMFFMLRFKPCITWLFNLHFWSHDFLSVGCFCRVWVVNPRHSPSACRNKGIYEVAPSSVPTMALFWCARVLVCGIAVPLSPEHWIHSSCIPTVWMPSDLHITG